MKALKISGIMIVVLALVGTFMTISAQQQTEVQEILAAAEDRPCDVSEEKLKEIIESTDDPEPDLKCCGVCNGRYIEINGERIEATLRKSIVVKKLLKAGINNPNCWLAGVQIAGAGQDNNKYGSINIETKDGAPSHIQLVGVTGDGTQFPAKVYVKLHANLLVEGLPTLSSTDEIVLEANTTVNAWPPAEEVVYTLTQPATFVSADGEHTATFHEASVVMQHEGTVVAAN